MEIDPRPEFKLIVAGSRGYKNQDHIETEIIRLARDELKDYAVSIVSGMAPGPDWIAAEFAKKHEIKLYEFPADWNNVDVPGAIPKRNKFGHVYNARAGIDRNEQMANIADGLLAFKATNTNTPGTQHMIDLMKQLKKNYRVIPVIVGGKR